MRILVTAGATREPLDEVRFLSNVSTGATGAALADALAGCGHAVTLLRGEGAHRPKGVLDEEVFSSTADLLARLARQLGTGAFDVAIMAAAVADYRPERVEAGKISSVAGERIVRLVRNPKLLPQLKSLAPRPLGVVGFKLTVGAGPEQRRAAVAQQWAAGGVDATVQNDLHEIRTAPLPPFYLWREPTGDPQFLAGVPALAEALVGLFPAIKTPPP